ncbi:MAG: lysine--tRNA ligase [Clostridia bacterium]
MSKKFVEQEPLELSEILRIRRDKLATLKDMDKNPYAVTKFDVSDYAKDVVENFVEQEDPHALGQTVTMAGRIMSRRGMGKAVFMDLRDTTGRIQLYVKIDVLGEEAFKSFLSVVDIGDIVGLKGRVFKTQRGEISVNVSEINIISKSLLPLPEKYHGLKDIDARYRQRYLDLIMNPDVKDTFRKRSQIIKEIRNYLDDKDFMEVETSVLHTQAGGASARPFITHHNALNTELYLRIALELHLKRLIVGGLDRVYEIGRVFRNEGMDTTHNPEFTMLELYQAYTDYEGMMNLTEELIQTVAAKVCGDTNIICGDVEIDLGKPFARLSMVDAIKEYSGVDFMTVETLEDARALAKEHHIEFETRHKKGEIINLFFEHYVEEKLIQPTFITGHPTDISPLAKKSPENPEFTERFELFILGHEYANAFSELNDPIDQRERFEAQAAAKAAGDDEACEVDEDFLAALEYAMPPTGGLGIGVDRLVMLLTNSVSIRDVLLFPTMKPIV